MHNYCTHNCDVVGDPACIRGADDIRGVRTMALLVCAVILFLVKVASKILLFYWLEQTATGFTVTVCYSQSFINQ